MATSFLSGIPNAKRLWEVARQTNSSVWAHRTITVIKVTLALGGLIAVVKIAIGWMSKTPAAPSTPPLKGSNPLPEMLFNQLLKTSLKVRPAKKFKSFDYLGYYVTPLHKPNDVPAFMRHAKGEGLEGVDGSYIKTCAFTLTDGSVLHFAVSIRHDPQVVKAILDDPEGELLLNQADEKGRTPLQCAIECLYKENRTASYYNSPTYYNPHCNLPELMDMLLSHNPDVNLTDIQGHTPLFRLISAIFDPLLEKMDSRELINTQSLKFEQIQLTMQLLHFGATIRFKGGKPNPQLSSEATSVLIEAYEQLKAVKDIIKEFFPPVIENIIISYV